MGITVDWYTYESLDPIIHWVFEQRWDWHDFAEADRKAYRMAAEADRVVHSLVDFRASKHIPHTGAFTYFSKSVKDAPPNRGTVVVIGLNPLLRAFEPILRRLYPSATASYVTVSTLEEAHHLFLELQMSHDI